jgi:gamma-glutamylcyclotransferase
MVASGYSCLFLNFHPKMKYFAYGSNMNAGRMKERGVRFISRKPARLHGYKLVFNKKATHADFAYANISKSEKDVVEGALYEFPDEDILKLDNYESYPAEYDRQELMVTTGDDESVPAMVYIARPEKTAEGYYPKISYVKHLLKGKDVVSREYYERLLKVRTRDN